MSRLANRRPTSHSSHTGTRRRVLTGGLAAGLAVGAPRFARAVPFDPDDPDFHPVTFRVPAPTGRKALGTAAVHLIDRSRPDPSMPSGHRKLMVSLWYPTSQLPDPVFVRTAVETRTTDARFALDQLERVAGGDNPVAESNDLPPGLAAGRELGAGVHRCFLRPDAAPPACSSAPRRVAEVPRGPVRGLRRRTLLGVPGARCCGPATRGDDRAFATFWNCGRHTGGGTGYRALRNALQSAVLCPRTGPWVRARGNRRPSTGVVGRLRESKERSGRGSRDEDIGRQSLGDRRVAEEGADDRRLPGVRVCGGVQFRAHP